MGLRNRNVKACQFSISNQALLSREQKQDGTIFILMRNDSVYQFRHACTDHSFKPIYKVISIRTSRSTLTRWVFDAEEWWEILTDIYANFEFTRASTSKAKLIENQILQTTINNKEVIIVHCECLLVIYFQAVSHFSPFFCVAVRRSCHVKPCYYYWVKSYN